MSENIVLSAAKPIPKYWPISSFIHHNPLTSFEDLHFKEGLKKAKELFGAKTYMPPSYYIDRFEKGDIDESILDSNLLKSLKKTRLGKYFDVAKEFMVKLSSDWDKPTPTFLSTTPNSEIKAIIASKKIFSDDHLLFEELIAPMRLIDINDAIFDENLSLLMEKEIVEFITRFLDEGQTTYEMPDRIHGLFSALKLYENFSFEGDASDFIEQVLQEYRVKDKEHYIFKHLLTFSGWTGFIKYRSGDNDYNFQQEYPTSLEEWVATLLYYESKYLKQAKAANYEVLESLYTENGAEIILKILKSQDRLDAKSLDAMEEEAPAQSILEQFRENAITQESAKLTYFYDKLPSFDGSTLQFVKLIRFLKEEEGYIWVKSIEESHIRKISELIHLHEAKTQKRADAFVSFCIDVRSEVVRRNLEHLGNYKTFGLAGFLGIPIGFVEFDKGHEQFLCPAVIKPKHFIFELPKEDTGEYKKKKGAAKTFKKVLSTLKNSPFSPFIMVEAIGWLFGIKLFGKTFFPKSTYMLFKGFKPTPPPTTYTIDPLSDDEIEHYIKKLHTGIIKDIANNEYSLSLKYEDIVKIWRHLVFDEPIDTELSEAFIKELKEHYQITKEGYEEQREKLKCVGFDLEAKLFYAERIFRIMGMTENFPPFVIMTAHGSISDNNPFESALDCGACGGNPSLPNIKAFCMIANRKDVREGLKERGIHIDNDTIFVPAIHNTTTDETEIYPDDFVPSERLDELKRIQKDIDKASQKARYERMPDLPLTTSEEDIETKKMDWSEPRPEWGLSGNILAYVGPREATKQIALQNKIFLQEYDHTLDNEELSILTQLYDGPLVVGEWINLEHYFSTVDNSFYGAGSKVYHNVVSKIGVFYGNYSDLRIGLPTQTVLLEGKAYHEPIRLIVYLEAPLEKGLKAVEKSKLGGRILTNEWVRLVVIDKQQRKMLMLDEGEFVAIKEW